MKVCEWKFSFSFAYIREKFFFEFSSFYPRYVYYRFPRTRTAGRSVFSKTPIEPNMKKIRESCQTGLAKTWLCSSLRDKILPVNRNDNPRNQSISANRFQPRFRAIDYIDHFKLKRVYGDRYSQRYLHLFKSVPEKLFQVFFVLGKKLERIRLQRNIILCV